MDADLDTPIDGVVEDGVVTGGVSALGVGNAKASSAKTCVIFLLKASALDSGGEVGPSPNWNFCPRSCNNENSSNDGNREANSSAAALLTSTFWESRAAKGSEDVPLIGDGLGFATGGCCAGTAGLPLLIGVISGKAWTCWIGVTFCRPIMGGEATVGSGVGSCWFLRSSDCDRWVYILYCQLIFLSKLSGHTSLIGTFLCLMEHTSTTT
jgi:hypothetical protein